MSIITKFGRPVWQPIDLWGSRSDFSVIMDEDFAREMIRTEVSKENQNRLNELANDELKGKGVNWFAPYTFHKDTAFVEQIYIGNNGKWLALESYHVRENLLRDEKEGEAITYTSHNINTLRERNVLLSLMDLWVYYSGVVGE